MLSLRASDYLGPQVLCSKGEPGEEVRKVRSASEGRYEWPMSLPVEGAEPLPWFRPREPLYPPPAYQRYPRYTVPYRPFPEGLPFPAERPTSPPYYRGGSLKHRILHPPPSIRIVEPPAALLAAAPLSAPPIPLAEGPRLAVSSMHPPGGASRLHYPAYFLKGSIIQLGTGLLKKVEDLHTEDFVTSANVSRDLRIDSSRVLQMATGDSVATLSFSVGQNQVQVRRLQLRNGRSRPPGLLQVTVEAPVEHPFFVFNRGWSSCNPERSLQRYRLQCQRLSVGDVCISLTHRAAKSLDAPPSRGDARGARSAPKTDPMNPLSIGAQSGGARKRRWSAPDQVTTHAGLPMPQRTATT